MVLYANLKLFATKNRYKTNKTDFGECDKNGILEFAYMDNFRKKRPGGKQKEPTIVDGFIRRTSAPGNTSFKQEKKSTESLKIDDFKRPEGFTPRTRSDNAKVPDGTSLGRKRKATDKIDMELSDSGKKKQKTHKKRRPIKKGFTMMLSVCILAAGFVVGFTFLRTSQVFEGGGAKALALECNTSPDQLTGEGDGRVNILLLGKGGSGHDGPDLTDTIMIASVDTCQKDAALLSIPRDLYVQVPGDGSMKINSVYAINKQQALYEGKSKKQAEAIGIEAIEKTIEDVIDLPINYYAMVDFEGFRKAIDTVGGITVNADEALYDPSVAWENNYNSQLAVKGENNFDGKQALLYARSRHGSARGDFDRSERQRQVIVALREKIFTLGTFGNPVKVTQLISAFGGHVRTNLSVEDIMKLYDIAKEIDGSKVSSVGLADPPNNFVTTGNIGGLSVVIPKAGLYHYADIQSYIRSTLVDGFIRKENPSILVLNGTDEKGAASDYKKTLDSYGYNVIAVGDAPTRDYTQSVFVDLTKGQKRYTERYLELRLGVESTRDLPHGIDPGLADFVIIIGQDEASNN